MLPLVLDVMIAPISVGTVSLDATVVATTVHDFDPQVEMLSFTLSAQDDNTFFLHDLMDGSGVQDEVGGRVPVTLKGCVARNIPEGCLTFDIKP